MNNREPGSYQEFEEFYNKKIQSILPVTPTSRLADFYDKVPDILKAVADFDPSGFLGGIAITLERDYNKRITEFFKQATYQLILEASVIRKELEKFQKILESEKFEQVTYRYYQSALNTNQKQKIEYFAKLWKSGVTNDAASIDSIEEVYNFIDQLSLAQIHILVFIYKRQGEKILDLRQPLTCYEIAKELKVDDERCRTLCIQMTGIGLLKDFGLGRFDYKGPEKFVITDFAVNLTESILDVDKNEAAIKRSAVI